MEVSSCWNCFHFGQVLSEASRIFCTNFHQSRYLLSLFFFLPLLFLPQFIKYAYVFGQGIYTLNLGFDFCTPCTSITYWFWSSVLSFWDRKDNLVRELNIQLIWTKWYFQCLLPSVQKYGSLAVTGCRNWELGRRSFQHHSSQMIFPRSEITYSVSSVSTLISVWSLGTWWKQSHVWEPFQSCLKHLPVLPEMVKGSYDDFTTADQWCTLRNFLNS